MKKLFTQKKLLAKLGNALTFFIFSFIHSKNTDHLLSQTPETHQGIKNTDGCPVDLTFLLRPLHDSRGCPRRECHPLLSPPVWLLALHPLHCNQSNLSKLSSICHPLPSPTGCPQRRVKMLCMQALHSLNSMCCGRESREERSTLVSTRKAPRRARCHTDVPSRGPQSHSQVTPGRGTNPPHSVEVHCVPAMVS